MLELYQFELSQYCEKIRLILDYKGLEYTQKDVTPGMGQLELFRLSGQRQVPVLKDGDTIVYDSTEIAFYLDRKYPERPILPTDPLHRGQCLLMEEWADESIAIKGRTAFFGALNQHQNFRTALLPSQTPDVLKNLVGAVPGELLDVLGTGVGLGHDAVKYALQGLKQDLEALCLILQTQPYLIGDRPTLADLTVAGLSLCLKFPDRAYLDVPDDLAGKGLPGLADNPAYDVFFDWRDRLYAEFRQRRETSPSNDTAPTSIEID